MGTESASSEWNVPLCVPMAFTSPSGRDEYTCAEKPRSITSFAKAGYKSVCHF